MNLKPIHRDLEWKMKSNDYNTYDNLFLNANDNHDPIITNLFDPLRVKLYENLFGVLENTLTNRLNTDHAFNRSFIYFGILDFSTITRNIDVSEKITINNK